MFTGLVEAIGRVASVRDVPGGRRVRIDAPFASALADGESVAVNGVCLTAIQRDDTALEADVGPETARVTTLGELVAGAAVNLERSMAAGGRFGGHFVQGHVDGMGQVRAVRAEGEAYWITIEFPPGLAPFFVPKGSVAVDGISLTVAALAEAQFDVMIIPFTWQSTTLSQRVAGDRVNLECDMLGKYVVRALQAR